MKDIPCVKCKNPAQKYFDNDGYINKWHCPWCGSSGFMKNYRTELKDNEK